MLARLLHALPEQARKDLLEPDEISLELRGLAEVLNAFADTEGDIKTGLYYVGRLLHNLADRVDAAQGKSMAEYWRIEKKAGGAA